MAAKKPNPHWPQLVECWHEWHIQHKGFEPNFNGAQAKALKEINLRLKKLTEDSGMVYDLDKCLATFKRFLTLANTDQWLSNNFQLNVLYGKFDSIIAKGKPRVGAASIATIQQAFNDFYNQQ